MLSGCCVLTSKHHNADEFIEHGVNGFILPDNPVSYAVAVEQLVNYNYAQAIEIGQRGRETALKLFNGERYRKDLWGIIEAVAKGKPPVWSGDKLW